MKGTFDNIPVDEIISGFFEIDKKINSLHECSSEDFLNLNDYFKRFYKESKQTSTVIKELGEKIQHEKINEIYNELGDLHVRMELMFDQYENQLEKNISGTDQVKKLLGKMSVPIKNFKQNLTTLKLLITNLKLNVTYLTGESTKEFQAQTAAIDQIISDIKELEKLLDHDLDQAAQRVTRSKQELMELKRAHQSHIDRMLTQLHSSIELLEENAKNKELNISKLLALSAGNLDSSSQIIMSLQYHDIIRQKMEHIQQTHQEILEELKGRKEDNGAEEQASHYIEQIPEIAKVQVAQLMQTNKEYQTAIKMIMGQLTDTSMTMSDIASRAQNLSAGTNGHKSHSLALDKLQEISATMKDFREQQKTLFSSTSPVKEAISGIKGHFEKICRLDKNLEKLIKDFLDKVMQKQKSNKLTIVTDQINELYIELHKFSDEMQQLFKNTESHTHKVCNETQGYRKKLNEYIRTGKQEQSVPGLLDKITDYESSMDGMLNTISDKSREISEGIKSSLKNVKYYEFFDQSVEEIIEQLNKIYLILLEELPADRLTEEEKLSHIKEFYTMQTERDIHDKILSGGQEPYSPGPDDEKTDEDDEGDLELF